MRLEFGLVTDFDPDPLLIDEGIGTGDPRIEPFRLNRGRYSVRLGL